MKKGSFAYKRFIQTFGSLLALVVLVIFVTVMNPNFLSMGNILNLLRQVSTNALIAFGMTFVILTGGIDLSVGSTLALSAALSATFLGFGLPGWLAIILALVIGCLLGWLNGGLITFGRMAPFIATLATMSIFRGATLVITDGKPLTDLGDSMLFKLLGRGYIFGIPIPVIIMLVIFLILYFVLHQTAFGKQVFAIGGNEAAAYISGINVWRVKRIVYAISGVLAAVAGLLITSRLNSAQPTAGVSYEMDAIASVVLGGTSMSGGAGHIGGTLIGALIIGVLNNGLNLLGVSSFYQQIIKGIVIIIAVLLDRNRKQ